MELHLVTQSDKIEKSQTIYHDHLHPRKRYIIRKHFENHMIKKGRYFIAKTPFARQFIEKVNTKAVIFDIENPMKIEYFSVNASLDGNAILFVGSLSQRKGVEDLLLAFAQVRHSLLNKHVRLRIIGHGDSDYVGKLRNMFTIRYLFTGDFFGFFYRLTG